MNVSKCYSVLDGTARVVGCQLNELMLNVTSTLTFTFLLLLIIAGDVEVNPGPFSSASGQGVKRKYSAGGKMCAVATCGNRRIDRPDLSYFHFPLLQ